jgi:trafficking protein particle complex subunit 5
MVIDSDPSITRYISVPRDMSQLSCSSFTAGIVEAVLDGLGFVGLISLVVLTTDLRSFQPARVTAHNTPTDALPNRTTILIKLEKSVLEREESFK